MGLPCWHSLDSLSPNNPSSSTLSLRPPRVTSAPPSATSTRSAPPPHSSSKSLPLLLVPPNSDDPSRDGKLPETETTRPSETTTTLVTSASTRSASSPTTSKTFPSCPRKNSNTDAWQCSPSPESWHKNSSTERRSLST